VFIDDVVEAFLLAAQRVREVKSMETYAVCTGSPIRLRDLVETWQKVTGKRLNIQWGARPYRPREVMRPWSGGTVLPGWRPTVGLEEGVRRMETEGSV
jgi:nucleoside-diphosphate-sugar epimerase